MTIFGVDAFLLFLWEGDRKIASKNLKGITLQIGGDTTELSKALKKPDKDISDLQSKLKSVNQMLKFDPSNTELLAQKQRLLKEQIAATEDK